MKFKTLCTSILLSIAIIICTLWYIALQDLLGGRNYLRNASRAFEKIEIRQHENGIKYVNAETFDGAMYGLGVAQARDRLWQLYFFRYLAQGRLSEIVGSEALETDIMMRNIGVPRVAKKMAERLGNEDRQILEQYAKGVNDYIDSLTWYPIEFYLLWAPHPETWKPEDVLMVQVMLQYFLSFDWFLELTRQRLTEIYDKELVDRMLPFKQEDYFFNNTEIINDEELRKAGMFDPDSKLYDVDEDLLYYRGKDQPKAPKMNHFEKEKWHNEDYIATPGGIGSNCWTVSGNLTQSGKPLLACDPHLNKQLQSMWYLVGLTWKDQNSTLVGADPTCFMVGASVVGVPLFTYGRSQSYAWGATAVNPDNSDLYVEKISDDGKKFFFNDTWRDIVIEKEIFKVRFADDFIFEQKFTVNGPLLYKPSKDDLGFSVWFPLEFLNQNNHLNYSMRWVYHEDIPNKLYSITKELLQGQPTIDRMMKFFENQNMLPLNMNFVTKEGDIGYHLTGLFPKRKYNVAQGVYPKKGWLLENLWQGFVDPKEHPRLYNPQKGFIVSANNFVTTKNAKHGVTHAFSFTHRFIRLNEMFDQRIKEKGYLDVQDMIDGQLDTLDIQAQLSTEFIIKNVEKGLQSALDVTFMKDEAKKAEMRSKINDSFKLWRDWNFKFELDQIQASIYLAFEVAFATFFQQTKIDNQDVRRGIHGNVIFDNFYYKEIHRWADVSTPPIHDYCYLDDYVNAGKENNCHEFMGYIFIKAIQDLTETLGSDMEKWQLGKLQITKYEHKPFSKTPLRSFFERQMPQAGSRRTPNFALVFYHKGNYRPIAGPIIRLISDMSDDKNILAVTDSGTEMRAFSPFIDDQMQLFHSGKYVTMPTPFNTEKWPSKHNQENLRPVIDIKKTVIHEQKQQSSEL